MSKEKENKVIPISPKEWAAIKRAIARVCSAITGKNIKVADNEYHQADAVAYTSANGVIHANPNHPLYAGLTLEEHKAALIGVLMHELMHQILTNFALCQKAMMGLDNYEKQIFGELHNVMEDARIEHYAYQFIGGVYLDSLKFIISYTWKTARPINEAETAFGQLMAAMIQFGDLGQVKGHFTHLKAKKAFLEVAPIFYDFIFETNDRKTMKMTKEVFEITRAVWEEEVDKAKAMEEMMKALADSGKQKSGGTGKGLSSAEDDSDSEGDSTTERRKASISEICDSIRSGGAAGSSGKGSKVDYNPETADEAQEAADVAKECAEDAARAADKAEENAKAREGEESLERAAKRARNAADKAAKAAQEAQEAADESKACKDAGDSEGEAEAAKRAGKAAMRASTAAKAAEDNANGSGSSSKADINATAEDAAESAKDADAAAREAEKSAQDAAEKAKNAAESGKSGSSGESGDGEGDGDGKGNEAETAAKNAARAARAAENAKKAAEEAKAHAEAAKAAKEAGDAAGEAKEAKAAERAARRAEAAAKSATKASNGELDDEATDAEKSDGTNVDSSNTDSEVTDRCLHGGRPDYSAVDSDSYELEDDSFDTEFDEDIYELSDEDFDAIDKEIERCIAEDERADMEKADEVDLLDIDIKSPRFRKAHSCYNRRITVGDADRASELYSRLLTKLGPGISSLTAQLRRIFRNDQEEIEHRANGKVNQKRLNSGRKTIRVFDRKRSPAEKSNLSVLLLVDESGSMSGSRAEAAKMCAISLSESLANCNVPCYVIGFTADTSGYDVVHNHYITWRNSKADRLRLLDITARCNNFDGYSIRYAGEVLKKHNAEHKLMIVISDGQPACSAYYSTDGIADTKDAIREVRKYASVLGVSIGNDTDVLHTMYGKDFLEISDVSELFAGVAKKISRLVKEWE
jgi:cobalamin biosynthesis protein CobT